VETDWGVTFTCKQVHDVGTIEIVQPVSKFCYTKPPHKPKRIRISILILFTFLASASIPKSPIISFLMMLLAICPQSQDRVIIPASVR